MNCQTSRVTFCVEMLPDSHIVVVVGVVVALEGGPAGLVPAVLLVLYQEGGALVHQGVDAHLGVDVQLARGNG